MISGSARSAPRKTPTTIGAPNTRAALPPLCSLRKRRSATLPPICVFATRQCCPWLPSEVRADGGLRLVRQVRGLPERGRAAVLRLLPAILAPGARPVQEADGGRPWELAARPLEA